MGSRVPQVAVALFAIAVLIMGRPVSYPDNVHTVHGLPLTWGVHQLVTIVGPVDTWRVDIVNLAVDLLIWFGLVLATPYILEKVRKR
jgi:hypothetical protein